jgi:signal transduction histidine kinase
MPRRWRYRAAGLWLTGVLCVPTPAAAQPPAITFGGDSTFPPYEFLDSRGRPVGFHVDLVRAVGEELGVPTHFRLGDWSQAVRGLQQGRIDVVAMFRSAARERRYEFIEPHKILAYQIYVRRGEPMVKALAELEGQSVIVQRSAHMHEHLQRHYPAAKLVLVSTEDQGLRVLAEGKHRCAVLTQHGGQRGIKRRGLGSLLTAGAPLLPREYCLAVRKGNTALKASISRALATLKTSGRYNKIYQKWFEEDLPQAEIASAFLRYALWVVIPLVVVIGAIFVWTWSLRRLVAQRTAALEQELAERKRAEERRIQLEAQLRQAKKMEAVGHLAAGIAHDFNNLLSPIIGFSDLLLADAAPDGESYPYLKQINHAGEQARQLTAQLLAFGRKQTLVMGPLDLNAMIRELKVMLRRLIREDIAIELDLDPRVGAVNGDRAQLEQVVVNLVINANDAMPRGGRITIATAEAKLEPKETPVLAGTLPPGTYLRLEVRDTGTGMPAEIHDKIFDPFFTTKEVGEGTGLGLATALGIIKQHAGEIAVQSAPGAGTVFTVLLPVTDLSPQPESPSERQLTSAPTLDRVTVLVVEDDPAVLKVAHDMLVSRRLQVLAARKTEEAIRLAEQHPGTIDLLLTDVVMPQMNGKELYLRISQIRPGIKVLYMSGYTDDVISEHGVLDEGVHYLPKPFTVGVLIEKVREALAA